MTQTPPAAAPEFRVGGVFSRAFSILSRNFVQFVILTGIATLPNLLFGLSGLSRNPATIGIGAVIGIILAVILGTVSQAVVLYGAFQDMRGRPFDIADSLRKGLARFWPIIGCSIFIRFPLGIGLLLLPLPRS